MLVVNRRQYEEILVGPNISIMVMGVNGGSVAIGVQAPKELTIDRKEVAISKAGGDGRAVVEAAKRRRTAVRERELGVGPSIGLIDEGD